MVKRSILMDRIGPYRGLGVSFEISPTLLIFKKGYFQMRVIHLKRKVKAVYDGMCPGIWDLFYEENTLIGTLRADEEIPAKDLQEDVTLLLTYQERQGNFPPKEARLG